MSDGKGNFTNPGSPREPVQFPVRPAGAETERSVDAGVAELARLARQAFEERHRKNCLALTRAILKIDPENREALVMESWVRSDLEQDLNTANRLFRDAQLPGNRGMFDQAERILRTILAADPENEGAKTLLAETVSALGDVEPRHPGLPMRDSLEPSVAPPIPRDIAGEPRPSHMRDRIRLGVLLGLIAVVVIAGIFEFRNQDNAALDAAASSATSAPANAGLLDVAVADGVQVFINGEYRGTAPLPPLSLAPGTYSVRFERDGENLGEEQITVAAGNVARNTVASAHGRVQLVVVPTSGVTMVLDGGAPQAVPLYVDVQPGDHQLTFTAAGYLPETVPITVSAGERRTLPVLLKPSTPPAGTASVRLSPSPPPTAPPTTTRVSTVPERNTAAAGVPAVAGVTLPSASSAAPDEGISPVAGNGRLSVSSVTPVEIYIEGQYVASTPATLELPPGSHAVEYRYQNLRQVASYEITGNETTTATVSFDVTIRVNARPWAEVFVDGIQMRSLGQTPLSQVRVPVGSVLVFRHPDFPEKRYRVTGDDTAVQIVFP